MSDAQDIAAIQAYLKGASAQAGAFVAETPSLDASTRIAWYALSGRVLRVVSSTPMGITLADARQVRDDFNAMVTRLSPNGTLAARISQAPPSVIAPPPTGTPNPLFGWLETAGNLVPLVLAAIVLYELKGRR